MSDVELVFSVLLQILTTTMEPLLEIPWTLWSVMGFIAFALITFITGGKVKPKKALLLCIICGPGTWSAVILWTILHRIKRNPRPALSEWEKERAIALLQEIHADHHTPEGDTVLSDSQAAEVAQFLALINRKTRFTTHTTK